MAPVHARGGPSRLPDAVHAATPAELKDRIAAERSGQPFLLYRDGGGAQQIHSLAGAPPLLTIGRSAVNDIALCWDRRVSRIHGHLERLTDTWTYVDDGLARNGSFLDGERVSGRARLRDGGALLLGATILVFRKPSFSDTSLTACEAGPAVPQVSAAQLRVLTALCRPCIANPLAVPASNREIADELVIGFETVKSHLKTLFALFALDELPQRGKRAALARRVLALGIVPAHDRLA